MTRREILGRRRATRSARLGAWWVAILVHGALAVGLSAICEEHPAPVPAPRPWIGNLSWDPPLANLEPAREPLEVTTTVEVDAPPAPNPPLPTAFDLVAAVSAEPLLVPPSMAVPPSPSAPRTLPFTAAFADTRRAEAWRRRFDPPPPPVDPATTNAAPAPDPPAAAPPPVASSAPAPSRPSQRARPVSGSCPPPVYPAVARRRRWAGTVTVQMSIDPQGTVATARILRSSGHAVLDEAARRAALAWRFAPALRNGEPVAQLRNQPFTFRLAADE